MTWVSHIWHILIAKNILTAIRWFGVEVCRTCASHHPPVYWMFTLLSRGLDCALHISHKVTTSFFFTAVQRIYAIFICNMHNVCTNFLGSTDMWLEFLNQVSQILWLLREALITQTSVTKLKLKFPYFPPSPVLKAIDLLWICVESLVNSCPYHQRQKTETCVGDSLYTAALWNWISLWAWACSSRMWRVCQSYLTFGKQTCTSPVHRLLCQDL